jgi:hypothetical protein
MGNINLKKISTLGISLINFMILSSIDSFGMEDENKYSNIIQSKRSSLDQLLKSPHIFVFADFEEDEDVSEKEQQENIPNNTFFLPNPENPIYGFSDNAIVFDYDKRELFSKSPLTIVCPNECNLYQVKKPKNTLIHQCDKDYAYIKQKLPNPKSSPEEKDDIAPFSGSIYKDISDLFAPVKNYEKPILHKRPSRPYQMILQLKEGEQVDWKSIKHNTIIREIPKEDLFIIIEHYDEEPITGEYISDIFPKFGTCREQNNFMNGNHFYK